jgi:hypothetical protein
VNSTALHQHQLARRALRAAVDGEQRVWKDRVYRSIVEQHLEPLLVEAERFERELLETHDVTESAMRRLDR